MSKYEVVSDGESDWIEIGGEKLGLEEVCDSLNAYKQLKQRELELMAQVDKIGRDFVNCVRTLREYSPVDAAIYSKKLNETPQQSLAEHDAEVIMKFIKDTLGDSSFDVESEIMIDAANNYANQLRQKGNRDESTNEHAD